MVLHDNPCQPHIPRREHIPPSLAAPPSSCHNRDRVSPDRLDLTTTPPPTTPDTNREAKYINIPASSVKPHSSFLYLRDTSINRIAAVHQGWSFITKYTAATNIAAIMIAIAYIDLSLPRHLSNIGSPSSASDGAPVIQSSLQISCHSI